MEYMIHLSQISHSQKDLLRQIPFVALAGNETPPENSSLTCSRVRRVDHCAVGQVFRFDDDVLGLFDSLDSQGTDCVDLGRDSDLRFSEVQLNQSANGEWFAENSRGIRREAADDEFGVLERDFCSQSLDGICELPVKNLELPMQTSGFDTSRTCLRVESTQKVEEEGNGNRKRKRRSGAESPCNVGADIPSSSCVLGGEQVSGDNGTSMQKNMGSGLEEEDQWKENYSDFDALKLLKENYESDDDDDVENAANGLGSFEEGQKKKKISPFDVLKFLKEKEDSLENVSLLEDVVHCGVTFPRPRWWLDNDLFRKQWPARLP